MATIINNPGNDSSGGGSGGLIVAVIAIIIVLALFFMYGLPAMRNNGKTNSGGTTVEVPDKIDVNVNK